MFSREKAAAAGHSCIATILHVAPDAGARLEAARVRAQRA